MIQQFTLHNLIGFGVIIVIGFLLGIPGLAALGGIMAIGFRFISGEAHCEHSKSESPLQCWFSLIASISVISLISHHLGLWLINLSPEITAFLAIAIMFLTVRVGIAVVYRRIPEETELARKLALLYVIAANILFIALSLFNRNWRYALLVLLVFYLRFFYWQNRKNTKTM